MTIPYTLLNGFPHFQGKFLTSKVECQKDGVDPKSLVGTPPTESTSKYYLRMGMNPDGNEVIDDNDLSARRTAEASARDTARRDALTPDQRAREDRIRDGLRAYQEIERLEDLSQKALTRDTDDMNIDRGYRLQAQAAAHRKQWIEQYPEASRAQRARALRDSANHERDLASGALTYDCDGSLSREDQQQRHDSFLRRAAELDRQAAELENQ